MLFLIARESLFDSRYNNFFQVTLMNESSRAKFVSNFQQSSKMMESYSRNSDQILLSLHTEHLKNATGSSLHGSVSSPYAIVTRLSQTIENTRPTILGTTEVCQNNLSPQWTKTIAVDFSFSTVNRVHVNIFDYNGEDYSEHISMGSTFFDIGELLMTPGNIKAITLREGGILYCRAEKQGKEFSGIFEFEFNGSQLINLDGFLRRKPNPYFEVSKSIQLPEGPSWQIVYRSEVMFKDSNPKWQTLQIGINELCSNNTDLPLQVTIKDWDKKGKHSVLACFETNVNCILQRSKPRMANFENGDNLAFELRRRKKIVGKIFVTKARLLESIAVPISAPTAALPVDSTSIVSIGPEVFLCPEAPRPKFVDYLAGGLELQLSVAIDFTGSNGDPRKPGTLHYVDSVTGHLNCYEKVMSAIGSMIAKYDSSKKIQMMGFGAKFNGVINHCFQVGSNPEVFGIKGMIDAYRSVFRSGLTMSGPTIFAQVISCATEQAKRKQIEARRYGRLSYQILLIITDGEVTDLFETKRAIRAASKTPLSIVIIGVGSADFSVMNFLENFMSEEGHRNICQFVEFKQYEDNKVAFTEATLENIPDQVLAYFQMHGINPILPVATLEAIVIPDVYVESSNTYPNLRCEENFHHLVLNGSSTNDRNYATYSSLVNCNPDA
jgi:Copine/C2 domain